jgi:lysyl-tRNA synthetase class I
VIVGCANSSSDSEPIFHLIFHFSFDLFNCTDSFFTMDHNAAYLNFEKDKEEQICSFALVTRPLSVGPKLANPAFRHWAVLIQCSNSDGVKKEAVAEGLKEDGKLIKSNFSSRLNGRYNWTHTPLGENSLLAPLFLRRSNQVKWFPNSVR